MTPRRPTTLRWAISAAAILLASPLLSEGTQTGVVTGLVVDTAGSPLPGVTVSLSGGPGERTGTTGADGTFRFPSLEVGDYEVSADLLGMRARSPIVRVYIDRTTDVRLELKEQQDSAPTAPKEDAEQAEAGNGETIRILAVAPLLDRFDTRVGTSVSRSFLDELPVERIYQTVANLLPGVVAVDDGNPNVAGALRGSNLFLVDGVDTTDSTTGLFGLNLAFDAVDQVEVTTSAPTAEYGRMSGAVINVVTRRGGNDFNGELRWLLAGRDLRGSYESGEPTLANEIRAAETDEGDGLDSTLSATLGGPIVEDKLSFFAAFEDLDTSLGRPSLGGELWDESTEIQSSAVKLRLQPTSSQSLVAQYTADSGTFVEFSPFNRSPAENRASSSPNREAARIDRLPGDTFALETRDQSGAFSRLGWAAAIGQRLSLRAAVAHQERRLRREPRNRRAVTGGAPHIGSVLVDTLIDGLDTIGIFQTFVFNGMTDQGTEERTRSQLNGGAEAFFRTGAIDHALSAGFDVQRTRSRFQLNFPGVAGIDPATGNPVTGQLFDDRDNREPCLFDFDCTDFDPRTGAFEPYALLNFWSRPERHTETETLAVFVEDSFTLGKMLVSVGARFSRVQGEDDRGRRLTDHAAVTPRLGLKYDPQGQGKVLLSASYARLTEPFPQIYLDDFVRAPAFSGYTEYHWAGLEGEDCTGEDPASPASRCWLPRFLVPLTSIQIAGPNPSLDRAQVDELTLGFERQLGAGVALRLNYIAREWRDLWDDVLRFDGEGAVVADVRNLPEAERTHRALQVLVQKRLAGRWQWLGSYTFSETEGNLFDNGGFATFADFLESSDVNLVNRFGRAPYDRTHQGKVFANFRQRLGRGTLSAGGVLAYETGTPYQREQAETLGNRFLTPRGALELDSLFQCDLSLAYRLPLKNDLGLTVKLEAFNVTDSQSVLAAETSVDFEEFGGPRSLADVQRPRRLRLGVSLRF